MKLARPDVFHPRIVLAGNREHDDDAGLVVALRQRGLHARWLVWDDPETRRADLVILRATPSLDDFLAWSGRVQHLLNPPDAVAWNLDGQYLRDLEGAGVPTGGSGRAALIFIAGERSHAFAGARPVEPDFESWDVGYAALAATAENTGVGTGELLYARVDVNGDRVARLDLVAPALGWRLLDTDSRERAQRQFALGVESALERLGLGPLSRRGP